MRRLCCSPLPASRSPGQHARLQEEGTEGGAGAEGEVGDGELVDAVPSAAPVDAGIPDVSLYKSMLKVYGQPDHNLRE